jgi:hypothetical protein
MAFRSIRALTATLTAIVPNLQSSLTLFRLGIASELLFVGDAGTTEPSRPSRRVDFEFSNVYTPTSWSLPDANVAFSRARFTDIDVAGSRIPGAVEGVATFTAAVDNLGPYYGSVRMRYFGPRALLEDNSVRSSSTALVSGRIGYKFDRKLRVQRWTCSTCSIAARVRSSTFTHHACAAKPRRSATFTSILPSLDLSACL